MDFPGCSQLSKEDCEKYSHDHNCVYEEGKGCHESKKRKIFEEDEFADEMDIGIENEIVFKNLLKKDASDLQDEDVANLNSLRKELPNLYSRLKREAIVEKLKESRKKDVTQFYNQSFSKKGDENCWRQITKFNNFIKSVIISDLIKEGSTVLDIGGGKGQDILKYLHQNIKRLVLIDSSPSQVEEAKKRCEKYKHFNVTHVDDAFNYESFGNAMQRCGLKSWKEQFDVVSSQLAFHYAFFDINTAKQALKIVADALKPKGLFILTIPNGEIMKLMNKDRKEMHFSSGNVSIKLVDDNSYVMSICGTDSPVEPIVTKDLLTNLAKEEGLDLLFYNTFSEIFKSSQTKKFQENLAKTIYKEIFQENTENLHKSVSDNSHLYIACAFMKKSNANVFKFYFNQDTPQEETLEVPEDHPLFSKLGYFFNLKNKIEAFQGKEYDIKNMMRDFEISKEQFMALLWVLEEKYLQASPAIAYLLGLLKKKPFEDEQSKRYILYKIYMILKTVPTLVTPDTIYSTIQWSAEYANYFVELIFSWILTLDSNDEANDIVNTLFSDNRLNAFLTQNYLLNKQSNMRPMCMNVYKILKYQREYPYSKITCKRIEAGEIPPKEWGPTIVQDDHVCRGDFHYNRHLEELKSEGKRGQGAFGSVYKGKRLEWVPKFSKSKELDNRDIASKRLDRENTKIVRLVDEVNILTDLCGHPHVIKLLDQGVSHSKKYLYLYFEWRDMDLRNYLQVHNNSYENRLSPLTIKNFMYQICLGLDWVHRNGIVHEDLKPDNVLLLKDDLKLELADFGNSKRLPKGMGMNLQYEIVTLGYRAPEIFFFRNNKFMKRKYDHKIDVWSAGVMLLEMFMGYNPLFFSWPSKQVYSAIAKSLNGKGDIKSQMYLLQQELSITHVIPYVIGNLGKLFEGKLEPLKFKMFNVDVAVSFRGPLHRGRFTPDVMHLIRKMLELEPQNRFSILECLNHVYFKDVNYSFDTFPFMDEDCFSRNSKDEDEDSKLVHREKRKRIEDKKN